MFDNNAWQCRRLLDGVGVAIAPLPLSATRCSRAALLRHSDCCADSETWFLQYRPNRQEEPALLVFRSWLHGEAKRQRQIEATLLKQSGSG